MVLIINIPAYLMVYGELKDVSNVVLRSAKAEGGFMSRTQALIDEQVSVSNLDPSRLEVLVYPGYDEKVQKRDDLGIELNYRFPYNMVVFSYSEKRDISMEVKSSGVSLKFFK